MSHRQLPLTELNWQPPAGQIIAAELLAGQYRQATAQAAAEKSAVTILKSARRKAEALIREANKTRHQMHGEMRAEQEQIRQETLCRYEAQWLKTHITSLFEGEALEQQLIAGVSARIHHSIARVLTAWFEQQPLDDLLCARLAKQAGQMATEGALTLHIHPAMQERIIREFGSRFTLVTEPQFPCDRAILASPQLSVAFSLSDHFQQLLAWLRSADPASGVSDENN